MGKLHILLIIAALFYITPAFGKDVRLLKITCDEKSNPIGVPPSDLNFGWTWESDVKGDRQESYQVVVFDGETELWNTGRIHSADQGQIRYDGEQLTSGKKYFWKVRIWSEDGKVSDWSAPGFFVLSLEKKTDWGEAKWIGYEEMPDSLRLVPGIHNVGNQKRVDKDPVIPYFRKQFKVTKPVKEAYLFITGLGHYVPFFNGEKVSEAFLAPGWTQYDKQVLFNTYELTQKIHEGDNVLGALVGNGFHYISHRRYLKLETAFGFPKMIAQLKLIYEDGSEENIASDQTWKTAPSPITYSSIYGGEDYDARLKSDGWNTVAFDASGWSTAKEVALPSGDLEPERTYPLLEKQSFTPVQEFRVNDTTTTYDFGQNASGIIAIKLEGKKGQKVRIWPGELLYPDKKVNQRASGYPYYYEYTLRGDSAEEWRPAFTYYGFRYAMVEKIDGKENELPHVLDITSLHTRNSAPTVGTFQSSSDLMNRIFELINWAIKSNFQSVLTDCPHREKLGWLEQTHLMGNSVRYNYSLYHEYKKQIRDMIHSQRPDGLIPDIAPEYVVFEGGFEDSPEWGSAGVILPWMVYKWYGDEKILSEAYDMMVKYVAYLQSKSENHILSHGLGDWFDYGPNPPGTAQLTPISLTATATYFYDVKILAEVAAVLDRQEDADRFKKWADDIQDAFNETFFDPEEKIYATASQTALSMPLSVGLVEPEYRSEVFASLRNTLENDGFALTAGDVGFHYLVQALSEGYSSDLLFKMINREDVPGYGFQLAKGATALTESWPALEEVSNNHLMLGHVMEWFYTRLLGIRETAEAIASDKIIIGPEPVGDIHWAKGSYQSPKGKIAVDWKKDKKKMNLNCEIPFGSQAQILIPEGYKIDESSAANLKKQKISLEENGEIEVGGGSYSFTFVGQEESRNK